MVVKKWTFGLFTSLFIFLLASFFLASNPPISIAAETPADPEQIPVRVLLVVYDPILEAHGGVRTHQYFAGWNDPLVLADQLVTELNTRSHSKVKYQIVQTIERDEWPLHLDGQRYTDQTYEADYGSWDDHGPGNYNAIITDNQIESKVNNGEIDEVWLYGGPGFGWFEATTAGNGSYSTNGGPITGVNTKVFSILGLSYQRTVTEALHSYGHGVEGVMRRMYGNWSFDYGAPPSQEPVFFHSWDAFTVKNYDPGNLIGCGYVHGKMNSASYNPGVNTDWTNTNTVASTCNDWSNYPFLTGSTTNMNCSVWGCTENGGLKWWLEHLPYFSGTYDGYLNNWWRYFSNLDRYKTNGQPVIDPGVSTDFAENNSSSWSCAAVSATCSLTNDTSNKVVGASSVKMTTNGAFDTYMRYPSAMNANWDLTTTGTISFWGYSINSNSPGFQGPITVYLKDSAGNGYKYESTPPSTALWDTTKNNWKKFTIPLGGDPLWTRTTLGTPNLANIDYVEIHADTWGSGFTLALDSVGFTTDLAETSTGWTCTGASCSVTQSSGLLREGSSAIKVITNDDVNLVSPSNLNLNATDKTIVFWAYSDNPNTTKFFGGSPVVDLVTTNSSNYYRFTPYDNPLNSAIGRWQRFEIPTNGDSFWTRSTVGSPSLSDVDQIIIHSDSDTTTQYYILYDGLRFEPRDVSNPTVSITSPSNGSNVSGIVTVGLSTSENVALKRVDLLVDGQFALTDAVAPYKIYWNTAGIASGSHTLTAKAYDIAGNVGTSGQVGVNVQNDIIFSDGFESGNASYWSSKTDLEGDLSINSNAKLDGSWGLSALIDNTSDMYVTDTSPNNLSRYRARFYLDPNGITMANNDRFSPFLARVSNSTFRVDFGYSSSTGYRVRTQIYSDAAVQTFGDWVSITDAPHAIEVDWKASTVPGANNGYISLWVDGVAQGTVSGIDNDTKRVEEVRLGAYGIDTGTSGTIFLDKFESRWSTYIGL